MLNCGLQIGCLYEKAWGWMISYEGSMKSYFLLPSGIYVLRESLDRPRKMERPSQGWLCIGLIIRNVLWLVLHKLMRHLPNREGSWWLRRKSCCGLLDDVILAERQVGESTIDDWMTWTCDVILPGLMYACWLVINWGARHRGWLKKGISCMCYLLQFINTRSWWSNLGLIFFMYIVCKGERIHSIA